MCSLNHVAEKAGKLCRLEFSSLLVDAAKAAASAKTVHESLSRIIVIQLDKLEAIGLALAGLQDDCSAIQLQMQAIYSKMCKVLHPLVEIASMTLFNRFFVYPCVLQIQEMHLFSRVSGYRAALQQFMCYTVDLSSQLCKAVDCPHILTPSPLIQQGA